jgi:hypothetical protein
VAPWTETYRVACTNIDARGIEIDTQAFKPHVQALINDTAGAVILTETFGHLAKTDFEISNLKSILHPHTPIINEWRAGEAVAEHLLVSEHAHEFPWPHSRSSRNLNASEGGVDLVGFDASRTPRRFVLGEVKTSSQASYPPSVMTSRHGMTSQLNGLKAQDDRAKWAMTYLAHNALNKSWHSSFVEAVTRYLSDPADVTIVGILVRSTPPNVADIQKIALENDVNSTRKDSLLLRGVYVGTNGLAVLCGKPVACETTP